MFKQYYLGCLAHASYLLGDGGEAAVVDPQRDVEQYLEDARAAGLEIKHVIETHLHADFVSGHVELAHRAGARVYIGRRAGAEFDHVPVDDGLELRLGALTLRFLETPGHTPESLCILVLEDGRPRRLLTGDTLFIGDVGRPDLAGSRGHTPASMAAMLHRSLHEKILTLPDDVELYPAHGAGSSCGRFISSARSSTIGEQRRTNYALQAASEADFVKLVTAGLPPAPAYFSMDAELNRRGAAPLSELPPPKALTPAEVAASGATVLDVRDVAAYGAGHVPGSIHIGLGGSFASWAGSLLPLRGPLVLVADDDTAVAEAAIRLARVGLENLAGHLAGGMLAWARAGRPVEVLAQITVDELHRRLGAGEPLRILDVRKPAEHTAGHVPGARNVPVENVASLPPADGRLYVICGSGYRSSIAASLLLARGHDDVVNVVGGQGAWSEAGYASET